MKAGGAGTLTLGVKLAWVSVLSFSSGLPFGFAFFLLPIYLRQQGAELSYITQLLSIAGFAWTLKFLWAFLIDRYGTRKGWVLSTQLVLGATMLVAGTADPQSAAMLFGAAVIALAYASATQDIAVDAYTIALFGERELGPANGTRVTFYRLAMIAASGGLTLIAGITGRWWLAFLGGAAAMLGLFAMTLALPRAEPAEHPPSLVDAIVDPLQALFRQPGFVPVLAFVVIFKLGDFALQLLINPFWVDKGLTTTQIAVISNSVGFGATIAGALLGGWATAKLGVFRALWILGLIQAASNLGYWAAAELPTSLTIAYGAVIVEQFTGGMGTAAFLAFLMSICDVRYAAAQYALLSAAFGLGRTGIQFFSGGLAESMGYANWFLVSFALAFPAFLLLPWVKQLKEARGVGPAA